MKKIEISAAYKMTSPNPVTLVCTRTPEGKTNLATVSWWTYMSSQPPMLGFAMSKKSYSGEMVRQNKKVVLAMPDAAIADAAFKCGTVSGRKTDKASDFGIELADLPGAAFKVPVHTRLAFECSLDNTMDVGDHYLYVCTIDAIHGDDSKTQIFAWDGYAKLRPIA